MFDEAKFLHDFYKVQFSSVLSSVSFYFNKNFHFDDHIPINDKYNVVENDVKLVELFNTYFSNAIEKTTSKALPSLNNSSN